MYGRRCQDDHYVMTQNNSERHVSRSRLGTGRHTFTMKISYWYTAVIMSIICSCQSTSLAMCIRFLVPYYNNIGIEFGSHINLNLTSDQLILDKLNPAYVVFPHLGLSRLIGFKSPPDSQQLTAFPHISRTNAVCFLLTVLLFLFPGYLKTCLSYCPSDNAAVGNLDKS